MLFAFCVLRFVDPSRKTQIHSIFLCIKHFLVSLIVDMRTADTQSTDSWVSGPEDNSNDANGDEDNAYDGRESGDRMENILNDWIVNNLTYYNRVENKQK